MPRRIGEGAGLAAGSLGEADDLLVVGGSRSHHHVVTHGHEFGRHGLAGRAGSQHSDFHRESPVGEGLAAARKKGNQAAQAISPPMMVRRMARSSLIWTRSARAPGASVPRSVPTPIASAG